MLLPIFHVSAVALYIYATWWDQQYLDLPFPAKGYEEMSFKARHMFLTFWCLALQTFYFTVSLLNDFIGTNEAAPRKTPFIRSLKDLLFGLSFALAIYVGASFWTLYHIDRELIFPEFMERVFPRWLNHTLHTVVVVFIIIELLFTNKNYPSRKVGLTVSTIFFLSYLVWMHFLFDKTGAWVYPIFNVLNLPARIGFFVVSISVGLGIYILGEKLNSFINPGQRRTTTERKKR